MAEKKIVIIPERGAEIILTRDQLLKKPFNFPPAVPVRDSKEIDKIILAIKAITDNKN